MHAADFATIPVLPPLPLVPDQPLPPGAPTSLAAAPGGQVQAIPDLSPLSTELSTGASDHPGSRDAQMKGGAAWSAALPTLPDNGTVGHPGQPAAAKGPAVDPRPVVPKEIGKTAPLKPQTPDQIAEFARRWMDPSLTIPEIGRVYQVSPRSIQNWAKDFALGPRASAQAAMVKSSADHPEVMGPEVFDPLKDPEIAEALRQVLTDARSITQHSDLTSVQRRAVRLTALVAAKNPLRTWDSLLHAVDGLSRTILNVRRIESEIPNSGSDPVLLRKEAAAQMMKELKSVLSPEEQQVLARVVKLGADRLMRSRKDTVVPIEHEGSA